MPVLPILNFLSQEYLGRVDERLAQFPDIDRCLLRQQRHQSVVVLMRVADQGSVHDQLCYIHGFAFGAEGWPGIDQNGCLSRRQLNAGPTDFMTSLMQDDFHAAPACLYCFRVLLEQNVLKLAQCL